MNEMVSRMVDLLFQDVAESEETRKVYQDLMDSCQSHFKDLTDGGMSADDALSAIMEGLSDMQELISRYPRKEEPAEEEAEDAEPEAQSAAPQAQEQASDTTYEPDGFTFPAEGIRLIRADLLARDAEILPVSGDQIRIVSENMKTLRASREGDTLKISVIRLSEELGDAAEEVSSGNTRLMDLTLNELLGKVKNLVSDAMRTLSDRVSNGVLDDALVQIQVPSALLPELEITGASSDIRVELRSPKMTLRSASGDITVKDSVREPMDELHVTSTSGDIRVQTAWIRKSDVNSVSGDISLEGDFGTLRTKSVSGDIGLLGTVVDLQAKSVSGDIRATLLEASGGIMNLESTSGDIRCQLPQDSAEASLRLTSTVGAIHSDLPDGEIGAPLQLSVKTVSGDIRVEKNGASQN